MNEILDEVVKVAVLLLIGIAGAAAKALVAKLNAEARKHDLEYRRELTAAAVAATDQMLPDEADDVKLDNTKAMLGRFASRTLIEAAVLDRKPFGPYPSKIGERVKKLEDALAEADADAGQTGMEASCGE